MPPERVHICSAKGLTTACRMTSVNQTTMNKRQALHLSGLAAGPIGYGCFILLTLMGIAEAPLLLLLLPLGLITAYINGDQ